MPEHFGSTIALHKEGLLQPRWLTKFPADA
jgi:hypothetical protein